MLAFLIVSAIALLFLAPWYWVFAIVMMLMGPAFLSDAGFVTLIEALAVGGWVWTGAKFLYRRERREAEQEQARLELEQERKEEARKKRVEEKQRELALTEYGELAGRLENLAERCGAQALDMVRWAKAIRGGDFEMPTAKAMVMQDALRILGTIVMAAGAIPDGAVRLCYSICSRLEPDKNLTVGECKHLIEAENHHATLPLLVSLLGVYDRAENTNLAAEAAAIYGSLVLAASQCCSQSVAARLVARHFAELLRNRLNESSSSSNSSSARNDDGSEPYTRSNGNCQRCRHYYPVLGIQANANLAVIKQAYKDLVNVWHPDRFEHNAGLRHRAEGRFKDIQEAYNHVMTHFKQTSQ